MPSIPTESLVDIVYSNIKQNILTKKYAGGSKLAVRSLCEEFGVSETPVKQALNRLITDNLVENIPRRGMRVSTFDQEAFKETLEARCMVEQYSVEPAIRMAMEDKKFAKQLKKMLDESITSVARYAATGDEEDFDRLLDADLNFHRAMVKATNNTYIIETYDDMCIRQKMFFLCHANIRTRLPIIREEHTNIYNAIIKGDRLETEYRIKQYVDSVKSYL